MEPVPRRPRMPHHVLRRIVRTSPKAGHIPRGSNRINTDRRPPTSLPQSMENLQQLTTVSRDLPVPDTRDLPVSCTTTEGVQNSSNAISGYRTQSLLHLLSCRHIHIRQRGNRYPYATTRFTYTTTLHHVHLHSSTTWLRRCQLSANIPYRTRETTHSSHIYITHGIRLQRRRPTLQSIRRLAPHRTRPIGHIYQRRLTNNYTYSLRAKNYTIRRQTPRRQRLEILSPEVPLGFCTQRHQA
jgi:hypothetical protein